MKTNRIEAFSDGVFAIAITILVFDLRPPGGTVDMGGFLLAQWPGYVAT